ncbi:S49 family peptidase [Thalassobaculum sp.]|uniref:S49 family peptidase n=1 Tax=Thalassobaculum sp. TaxID=2022740 RepID=UPI0032EF4F0A
MSDLSGPAFRRHVAAALDQPLALDRAALGELRALAEGRVDLAGFRPGEVMAGAVAATRRDGVAVIPVRGHIFPAGGLLSRMYAVTSPARIAADFDAALADASVDAIVLDVDSPGGSPAGVAELAREIRAAASVKPVIAYGSGMVASAAYWIAAAASQLVVEDTTSLGSVGVVAGVTVQVQPDFDGYQTFEVVSSNASNKRPDPRTESGLAEIRRRIDAVEAVFIDAVASFRGLDREVVVRDFGFGGLRVGADAVSAGLADRVGSFEDAIAAAQSAAGRSRSTQSGGAAGRPASTGVTAMDLQSLTAAMLAADRPDLVAELRQGYVSQAEATAAAAQATEAGLAEARVAAADAERSRIFGILDLGRAMPAETSAVGAALRNPSVDVGAAAVAVLKADDKARAAALAALSGDDPAALGAGPGEGADDLTADISATDDASLRARWDKSSTLRDEFVAFENFAAYARASAASRVPVTSRRASV